jgi:hypothetical protein
MPRDRAELRFVREIPDGDHNREVEIEATNDGLVIDEYITIRWDWIQKSYAFLRIPELARSKSSARLPSFFDSQGT